ncbi:MAG: hypothetical protein CMB99_02840 [Flavobacteriaceae bacterium]|nr:hypothetical protein [Flavobacteriaceae bacterium]|tara:strand:- start:144667 stop:145035 length:369 start_codon:yes stop_codon:yes gene_type:complete
MELSIKQLKNLLFVILGIVFIYLVYNDFFVNTKEENYKIAYEIDINMSFNGVVVKKYREKSNHNNPVLLLNNEEKVYLYEQFFSKIKLQDSIVKKKGNLLVYVYSNNSKIVMNLEDELNLMK